MNILLNKFLKNLSLIALMVTVLNVNAACSFIMHQPELPEAAMRFKI